MRTKKSKLHIRKPEREPSNWIYIGFLIGVLGIFFIEVFLKKGYFWEDFLEQNFPYRLYAARVLAEGKFPYWNPYIFGGLPFFADIQTGIFYPINLLLTLFVSGRWLSSYICEIALILQLLVAGIGMFFFAQHLRLRRTTAFFMAVVYMLNGRFIVHLCHTQIIQTFTFLPLLFLFLTRGIESEGFTSIHNLLICGLLLGIASYAGYPQAIVIILFGFLFYILYQIGIAPKKSGSILIRVILVLVIFTLIALCQYLPSYLLFRESIRGKYTYAEIVEGSFHPFRFITFLIPNYFGTTAQGDYRSYFGPGPYYQYWEQMAYIGIIPLILLTFVFTRKRRPLPWVPIILVILSLLIALGRHFPIHILLYKFIPFFRHIRTPAKFLQLTIFGLVWLSGVGLENLLTFTPNPKRTILIGGGLLFIIITSIIFLPSNVSELGRKVATGDALRSIIFTLLSIFFIFYYLKRKINPQWFQALVVTIAFLDLFSFGHRYNLGKINPDEYWDKKPLVRFLKSETTKEYIRVNTRCPEGLILPRNMGYVQEIWTTEGYNPLVLNRYVEARETLNPEAFFTLMNVKYQTIFDSVNYTLVIKEREDYLPRAKLFYEWEVIPDKDKLLKILQKPDFPLFSKILLERDPGIEKWSSESKSLSLTEEQVEITYYSINEIFLQVKTPQPAILVLSENYYPNWEVYIDGKKSPVFPVNYFLRGCGLPIGSHQVKFIYRERFFIPLLLISIIVIVISTIFPILGYLIKERDTNFRKVTRHRIHSNTSKEKSMRSKKEDP